VFTHKWFLPVQFVLLWAAFIGWAFSKELCDIFTYIYLICIAVCFILWLNEQRHLNGASTIVDGIINDSMSMQPKKLIGLKTLYKYGFLPMVNLAVIIICSLKNIFRVSKSKQKAFLYSLPLFIFFIADSVLEMTGIYPFVYAPIFDTVWYGAVRVVISYTLSLSVCFLMIKIHKHYLKKLIQDGTQVTARS
jgi:hypothetical protein